MVLTCHELLSFGIVGRAEEGSSLSARSAPFALIRDDAQKYILYLIVLVWILDESGNPTFQAEVLIRPP